MHTIINALAYAVYYAYSYVVCIYAQIVYWLSSMQIITSHAYNYNYTMHSARAICILALRHYNSNGARMY
jgi:hypothetical protein